MRRIFSEFCFSTLVAPFSFSYWEYDFFFLSWRYKFILLIIIIYYYYFSSSFLGAEVVLVCTWKLWFIHLFIFFPLEFEEFQHFFFFPFYLLQSAYISISISLSLYIYTYVYMYCVSGRWDCKTVILLHFYSYVCFYVSADFFFFQYFVYYFLKIGEQHTALPLLLSEFCLLSM